MLKLKVIACDVLNREISYLASRSKCFVDVTFLHQGLHCTPDKLRTMLQQEIDKANQGFPYNYFNTAPDFDYIVIGYGLCSNGIVGLSSERIPLIVPRGHDCITLLLGSKEHYREHFDKNPGTYWFSVGWIERGGQPSEERYQATYREYLDKYGEDNAEYLMKMEQGWLTAYKSATYINWDCLTNPDYYRDFTKKSAQFLNWSYLELNGDASMMTKILNGTFDKEEVLLVPPGKKIVASYDDGIIKTE